MHKDDDIQRLIKSSLQETKNLSGYDVVTLAQLESWEDDFETETIFDLLDEMDGIK